MSSTSLQNTLIVVARPDHGASNDIRLTFGIVLGECPDNEIRA